MTSQIYSRYIPLSKKKTPLAQPTPIPPHSPSKPILPSTTKDASSTYSRYIPPTKSKPKIDSNEDSEPLILTPIAPKRKHAELVEEEYIPPKKLKKQKQDKIDRNFTPPLGPADLSQNDTPDKPITEIRIRKKSKSKSEEAKLGEDVDEDDVRHKRLLGKRDKSLRKAQKVAKKAEEEPLPEEVFEEPSELHDLVPLPQPEPVPELAPQSLTAALPPWLSNPIRVLPTATVSFAGVGVSQDVEIGLRKKGFNKAFAVQAALLPYLLPGEAQQDGDFLVSAATGSGKTLAYILPMIENISHNVVTKLRGLIVLPTRELVSQAKEVSEMCASMFSETKRLRIGTAVGNETFKAEQASLMEQELVYDPEGYRRQLDRLNSKWEDSEDGSDGDLCDDDDVISNLPDHVIGTMSGVDILICTPGRLVEHLKSTSGFTLQDVQWLVVDEADKLLDQSFQDWLDVVTATLKKPRKVILSATITRDIGKLSGLKLYRPQLIIVEETHEAETQSLFLPTTLWESAVKVVDEGAKPLYLMDILRRVGLIVQKEITELESDSHSDSSDDFSDDSSSDDKKRVVKSKEETPHGALIFTKSNESAVRLGRLIALLKPGLSDRIGILTSTTRSSDRKSALKLFETHKMSILVASDLVSRGLDLPNLAHVVNYDIPTSLTSYVHRVGRTARAGRQGHAWTLFTSVEGRWFWNEIGKAEGVKRAAKVERVRINVEAFDRDGYEEALEVLGKESNEG